MHQNGWKRATKTTGNVSLSSGKELKRKPKGSNSDQKPASGFLYEPSKKNCIIKRLNDCPDCPDDEKKRLWKTIFDEMVKCSSSIAQRGQLQMVNESKLIVRKEEDGSTGSLGVTSTDLRSPSSLVAVTDGPEFSCARGSTDDGIYEFFVSVSLAEKKVLKGFGKIKKINKILIQVAMKDYKKTQSFLSLGSGRLEEPS